MPRQLEFPYASGEDGDKGHVTLNWLTCETADTGELLVLEMLERYCPGERQLAPGEGRGMVAEAEVSL